MANSLWGMRGKENHMLGKSNVLKGMALGALLMYALDPGQGRRRRARMRDGLARKARNFEDEFGKASRDLGNRLHGVAARARARFESDEITDDQLEERVRSRLGRLVHHPRAISVDVDDGHVTLRGPIAAHNVNELIDDLRKVPGVLGLDHEFDVRPQSDMLPDDVASYDPPSFWAQHWHPSTRLFLSAGAGYVTFCGLRRGGLTGLGMGALGIALLNRLAQSTAAGSRLVGVGDERASTHFTKTLEINAPVRCGDDPGRPQRHDRLAQRSRLSRRQRGDRALRAATERRDARHGPHVLLAARGRRRTSGRQVSRVGSEVDDGRGLGATQVVARRR
jgi:hypothetical protein